MYWWLTVINFNGCNVTINNYNCTDTQIYQLSLAPYIKDLPTYEKIYEGDRGGGGGGGGGGVGGGHVFMGVCIFMQIVCDYTYSFIVGIYNAMFNDLKEGKTI